MADDIHGRIARIIDEIHEYYGSTESRQWVLDFIASEGKLEDLAKYLEKQAETPEFNEWKQ